MNMKNPTSLFLVADAHLPPEEDNPEFFKILERLHALPPDCGIVFLGDVFDMWIALPGYETNAHRKFLDWCAKEKEMRLVVFLEGNHEFFVAKRHPDAFTHATDDVWKMGAFLAAHGDRINRRDWKYRLLRFGVRNLLTRALLRISVFLGFGPRLVWKVREGLRTTNLRHKKDFPLDLAERWLRSLPRGTTAVVGHFHRSERIQTEGRSLEAIPACGKDGTGIMILQQGKEICQEWNPS